MSTPEQPPAQGLTRKQLREQRMTGVTPVITSVPESESPEAQADTTEQVEQDRAPAAAAAPIAAQHLPRPAEPVIMIEPTPDAHVDLGVSPLTRRQAREQERIRTASVPVITPEILAAHAGAPAPVAAPAASSLPAADAAPEPAPVPESPTEDADTAEERDQPVLARTFGAKVLAEPEAQEAPSLSSFDDLLVRGGSTTGSVSAPNALILAPGAPSLSGPVTSTGEVLITGSLTLEGVGSKGHAPGSTDGKDVDVVLIDGELPAHSSPTPIAASAAISTVKSSGEMIRPPAPERGGRLMLVLAITAGALALALVGVLIVAFVTGVF